MKNLMEYLDEYKELLGDSFGKLNAQLKGRYLFYLVKKLNKNICFRCGQSIDSSEEFSIEHKIPYINGNSNLYLDLSNIDFAHRKCNSGESKKGTGKFKYFGISRIYVDRPDKGFKNYNATCNIPNGTKGTRQKSLSCFETQEEAAICRDLAIFYYLEGKSRLNFEQFREEYKLSIQPYIDNKRELFYKRGPIKDLVYKFYKLLPK